ASVSDFWGWLAGAALGLWTVNYFKAEIALYWLVTFACLVIIFRGVIDGMDWYRSSDRSAPGPLDEAMVKFEAAATNWNVRCDQLSAAGLVRGNVLTWVREVTQRIINFRVQT